MTTIVMTSPERGALRLHPILGLVVLAALLGGCTLGPIDRSIQNLITTRSGELDAVPARPRDAADPGNSDTQYDTKLETVNPPASALTYEAAADDRDPTAMLRAFAKQAAGADPEQEVRRLTLADVWRISQTSARDYMSAEEDYIFAAISLLIERHNWGPRFFDDLSTFIDGGLDDGEHDAALRVVNDLRVTQRLPYGGSVEAAWIWQATEQLRDQATGQYTQSSTIALSGNVPLLRGAGQAARESRIQAERNLVYAARSFERFRRQFFVQIARDYFDLLEDQASISNLKRRLISLYRQLDEENANYRAGNVTIVEVANAENQVLQTEQQLDNARESYITALDRFKIDLGIPVEDFVDIAPIAFDLSEPDISLQEAAARALTLRLDLQNERDRLDDSRRDIAVARNELLPDLDVNARLAIPTDPDEDVGGLGFDPDNLDYSLGVTFGLPLDRKQERLALRRSIISFYRDVRDLEAAEDNVILDARSSRRRIEQARANLDLAEKRVALNETRRERQQAQRDESTTQEILDAENDLIDAKNDRDQSESALRIAILEYLLATGQMRVGANGQFDPIPGMEFPPATLFVELDDLDRWWEDPQRPDPVNPEGDEEPPLNPSD